MPRILQVIILLLLPIVAAGREPVSPKTFVNINIGNEVGEVYYSLCQDSTGMVWVGTNMGLYGYDGYRMHKRFDNVPGSNTNINCIMVKDSLLYAGADTGVFVYDLTKGEHVPRGIVFPTDVRSLAFDGEYLWIGSLKGLYRYDSVKDTLQDFSGGLPHGATYAVCVTGRGDLYVGTYNGLCRYDSERESFVSIPITKPRNKKNLFVNALADDRRRNCLWIGTEGALFKYDYDSGEVSQLDLFDGYSVKSLTLDHDGNLIAGTDNGLFIYSRRRFERYRHDSRIGTSLSNNVVWSVMVDRDGNLWAGTESGLSEWVNSGNFTLLPLYQITRSSDGCRFYAIFRDSRGYLWLGGTNGIIRRSRDGQVKWYMMESKEYPLSHNRVRSICEDSRYELWAATDGGINRYDYVKEQFVNYSITDSTHTYNANWAYGIVEDHNGMMWVGSYLGGLFAIDRNRLVESSGECVANRCYNSGNGLPNNMINQVVLSDDGSKWVSSYKSGSLVNIGEGDSMKVLDVCDSYVQYIVPDRRKGGLWCGYHNGFAFVSNADTVQSRFTFPLAADIEIYSMEVVKDDLWISTSHGVWVMNEEAGGQIRHLRLPGRLYTSLYYDRASRKMLLGGDEELLVVDPSVSHFCEEGREIRVTALYVNDEPYEGESAADVGSLDGLALSHDQNRLTIEFSDFDYRLDNRKDFEYRIRGISDEWHSLSAGNNRIVVSNIPPGEYVLEIRPLDIADAPVKALDISVSPAWYQSWWAIAIYALLGILFMLWIVNFVRLKLRLRVERVRSEKTIEMVKSRMDFLTNMSHELKTPLSMIIGPLSKMINDEKNTDTRHRLDAIQQNALKLNTLIHRVLEVNRMDENPDNLLIYSQVEMVSFCHSIFDTYKEAFPMKQFVFDCNEERILMSVDVVKIESVINNVLSNACKYSGDGAIVSMSLKKVGGNVEIAIRDNGVGIPAEDLPFIFQRLYQSSATIGHKDGTGIGLYLAKTYVDMHHGSIRVQSEPGVGSTFTIVLPVGGVGEAGSVETVAPVADGEASGKSRILIVEDNAAIAAFLKEILSPECNCVVATNGKDGLDKCGAVVPDLIIVDEMMPVMDGMEMCRRIKRNNRLASIPIIMLTAKDDKLTEAESIKAGVDAFMSKPFVADMLKARVKQLLKSKEILRSNLRVENIATVKNEVIESAEEKLLADVTKVIEDNISDSDMNVGYVCEKTGLSSKQLYRLLKNLTGVSPVDYIRQIRMKKAAMLLQQHKFSVSEVMYMVGFSSASYFSKCFSAQFGCIPRQYIEKQCSSAV